MAFIDCPNQPDNFYETIAFTVFKNRASYLKHAEAEDDDDGRGAKRTHVHLNALIELIAMVIAQLGRNDGRILQC